MVSYSQCIVLFFVWEWDYKQYLVLVHYTCLTETIHVLELGSGYMILTINKTFHCKVFRLVNKQWQCHVVTEKTHFSIYKYYKLSSAWNPEVLGSIPVLGKKNHQQGQKRVSWGTLKTIGMISVIFFNAFRGVLKYWAQLLGWTVAVRRVITYYILLETWYSSQF